MSVSWYWVCDASTHAVRNLCTNGICTEIAQAGASCSSDEADSVSSYWLHNRHPKCTARANPAMTKSSAQALRALWNPLCVWRRWTGVSSICQGRLPTGCLHAPLRQCPRMDLDWVCLISRSTATWRGMQPGRSAQSLLM
jgi:hypothetical protein